MTDREKREKVIRALEICIGEVDDNCDHCPYSPECGKICNGIEATRDAIALLKKEEPRVMTLNEVTHSEDWIWYDAKNVYQGWVKMDDWGDGWITWSDSTVDRLYAYKDLWRCWTSRPNPTQMKETPWES